jgi:hypothetical protein
MHEVEMKIGSPLLHPVNHKNDYFCFKRLANYQVYQFLLPELWEIIYHRLIPIHQA